MKIILATPIYPPDVGGPAEYVKKLAEELRARGVKIDILSYGEGTSGESLWFVGRKFIFRHFAYFFKLLWLARKADIVYAFDPMAVGLPAYLVSKIRGVKFVMRLGGDYLWERDVEAGRAWTTLRGYYQSELWKEKKLEHFLLRKIFSRVDEFIFNTSFQAEIYKKVYNIPEKKIGVIVNPFTSFELVSVKPGARQIVFAGRFIKLKNLDNLILVFKKISPDFKDYKLILFGAGPEKEHLQALVKENDLSDRVNIRPPIPRADLLETIAKSTACVLPSLSEINPNFALESISAGTPILLTRENGLDIKLRDEWLFNPLDNDDFEKKLCGLLNNAEFYPEIKAQTAGLNWENTVNKHMEIFNKVVR